MRPGYFILSYSIDNGQTWVNTGPMLWRSLRKRQRAIHRACPTALSCPRSAFMTL